MPAGTLADRIVHARQAAGLNQAQLSRDLAKRLNRSPETIRRSLGSWERGCRRPRGYALEAIAAATGRPLAYFTDDETVA